MILPKEAKLYHTLHYIGWAIVVLFAWDVVVTISYVYLGASWLELPSLPLPLLGTVLVLFLSFRNTTAYARWWEARTLWGATINASRSFAREALTLLDDASGLEERALVQALVRRQIAFAHALRTHLRKLKEYDDIDRFLPPDEAQRMRHVANVPNAILDGSAKLVAEARARGWTDSMRMHRIESTMVDLSNAQGGMERIKNTPLPAQYGFLPWIFTQIFCLLLPVGFVDSLRLYTPLASTVVGFMVIGVMQIGDDLQDPFENRENDVPMTAMCRTIEIDLLQAMGEKDVPAPLQPVKGVLW